MMIALFENSQWEQKTLRQLKQQFPNVSFARTTDPDGATWTSEGTDYEAKTVTEIARPTPAFNEVITEGPLVDNAGVPEQSWVVTVLTQAELDAAEEARLDDLTDALDNGISLLRALGVEVFKLAKAAEPTLTPAEFKLRIRTTAADF